MRLRRGRLGRSLLLIVVFILATLSVHVLHRSTAVAAPERLPLSQVAPNATEGAAANCRYGATPLNTHLTNAQVQVIPRLGAGWYLNFGTYPPIPGPSNNAEFVHMLHVRQSKTADGRYLNDYYTSPKVDDKLAQYIANNPGETWIVGNEIERGPDPGQITGGQGDIHADVYARAYHNIYRFIKQADPTAKVAISALVQVTPNRLQYLTKVWDTYQALYGSPMPVDVWTMHLYALPEVMPDGVTPNTIANVGLGTDPRLGKRGSGGDPSVCDDPAVYCLAEHDDMDIFAEQVLLMRQWMKDRGQQNRPLLVTEYSILYNYWQTRDGGCQVKDEFGNCFTPDRVSQFMVNTFNFFNNAKNPTLGYPLDDNRLVQQWMWFSVNHDREGGSSNLVENDLVTFTQVGRTFQNHVAQEAAYQNLLVENAADVFAPVGRNGRATAKLKVTFRNNGNSAVDRPFTVSFYSDLNRTQQIGSVTVQPGVRGCATNAYTAEFDWAGLAPGSYTYWAFVDSGDVVPEQPANNADNIGSGTVIVNTSSIMLPLVRGE